MNNLNTGKVEEKLTAGLDLGDLYTHLCVLDENGEVLEEARVSSTPKAFKQRFRAMPPARLVLEAGTHSPWASRLLESLGHEVVVANPRMLRFIYGNDSKDDRADAAYLARVGKLDPGLLHPLIHRSEEGLAHRALLRSRGAQALHSALAPVGDRGGLRAPPQCQEARGTSFLPVLAQTAQGGNQEKPNKVMSPGG